MITTRTALLPIVAVISLVLVAADAKPHAAERLTGKVVSVYDGDTITVLTDGRQVKVRLHGIDAPELGQAYGQAAKQQLSELAFGKQAEIEVRDKDRWGRTIGTVSVNGRRLAEAMLGDGLAWHYRRYDRSEALAAAERTAKAAKRGLWADAKPVPPWEWRATAKDRKGQPAAR